MRDGKWTDMCAALVVAASVFFSTQAYAGTGRTDAYDLRDFRLASAGDLVDVCTLEHNHPDHRTAVAFCYGFFEGGIHYDRALESSPDHAKIVCAPDNATRTQAVEVFVTYVKANPQYAADMPIDAVFRALVDTWPCR